MFGLSVLGRQIAVVAKSLEGKPSPMMAERTTRLARHFRNGWRYHTFAQIDSLTEEVKWTEMGVNLANEIESSAKMPQDERRGLAQDLHDWNLVLKAARLTASVMLKTIRD